MKGKKRGNGEGTFYYDEKHKRWVGQKVFGTKSNGKPNRISRYGKTKKECIEKLNQYELKWKNGTLIEPSKLTVHDLIKMQIDDDYELNIIKPVTMLRRIEILNILDKYQLGSVPLNQLNELQIISFLKSIKHYSNSTISKEYNCLKKCLKLAHKKKLIDSNPFEDGNIIKPKSDRPDRKISSLTVEEEQKLINILNNEERNNRYRWQMLIMLSTGMRMGEINALTLNDISFIFNTISVNKSITVDVHGRPIIGTQTKTDAGMRILEITPTLKSLLQDYIANEYHDNSRKLLFYDFDKDKYISTSQVNSSFKRMIERYNIIPMREEYKKLSTKGKSKVAYKKYTYYAKTSNGYEILPKTPPEDWNDNFGNYYYKIKIADKEYNQHMMRHTFATRCIENDVDYKTLSDILGHTDISITLNVYCDVIGRFKKKQFAKIDSIQQQLNILGQDVSAAQVQSINIIV